MSWFIKKINSITKYFDDEEEEGTEQNNHDNAGDVEVVTNHQGQDDGAEQPLDTETTREKGLTQILTSILGTVKLGSDVLRLGISLPASLYEPLSILQRQSEMLEYSFLLDRASQCRDAIDRLVFVAGFAVSGYSGTNRYHNNFNPILGETFEYVDKNNGTRFLGEQVSHHPPISATHAENSNWIFYQNSSAVTKFLGNAVDINTQGRTHIFFPNTGDHFYYTNPLTRVHNILLGKMCIEHYGELHITNLLTHDTCKIFFKKCSFFQSVDTTIEGWIRDSNENVVLNLEGRWNEYLNAHWLIKTEEFPEDNQQDVWRVYEDNFTQDKYKFTRFATTLNETDDINALPPTDSRLRLDRKMLQDGDVSRATKLKKILEERQRSDKKKREEEDREWEPTWFKEITDEEGGSIWVFTGGYWEQKEEKN